MAAIEFLSADHGYALLVIIYTNIMLMYLMAQVGKQRKKSGVKYPAMYSEKDDIFNCYQRAHQNTLENLPAFYSTFIPVALVWPRVGSLLGALWVTSRFFYAWGYYTGDPKKRMNGAFGYIGQFGLLFMLIYLSIVQLGLIN